MKKSILALLFILISCVLHGEEVRVDDSALIAGRFVSISPELRNSDYFNHGSRRTRAGSATLEDALVKGWKNLDKEIDISSFKVLLSDYNVITEIWNKHPEFFYVSGEYSYFCSSFYITKIRPVYSIPDRSTIARMQAEIDAATAKAFEFIPKNASDLEILLALHDYLATHCEYETTISKTHIRDIYGPLVEGEAVCAGYTVAYNYLLAQRGIESYYVHSTGMHHAWNMVVLNGKKYHVDVTWDDPVFTNGERRKCFVQHENFLRDDAGIRETGHTSWDDTTTYSGSDSTYGTFFWKDCTCSIPCKDGYGYMVDSSGKLGKYSLATGTQQQVILTITDKWSGYSQKFSSTVLLGNNLIYNGPEKIYSYDLSTGRNSTVSFSYPSAEGKIYGIYQDDYGQLQANVASNPNVAGKYYDISVEVPVNSIILSSSSLEMKTTTTQTLNAMISPKRATNQSVTWRSSNSAVATVNSSGFITAVYPGKAVISATSADGKVSESCTVTVIAPVTGITLEPTQAKMGVGGGTLALKASVVPQYATNKGVTWKSSRPAVATVNAEGVVTALTVGETVITATTAEGNFTAECRISVYIPVTGITLNQTSARMSLYGGNLNLTATVSPQNATTQSVSWRSSSPGVATVDATGCVTPVATGNTIISCVTDDGGFVAVCAISVFVPVTGVTLDCENAVMYCLGSPMTLTASVLPQNATNKKVTWTSSKPSVATVDAKGVVTVGSVGETVIKVSTVDGNFTKECLVNVQYYMEKIELSRGWNLVSFLRKPIFMSDLSQEKILECRATGPVRPLEIELNRAYWIFSPQNRVLSYCASPIVEEIEWEKRAGYFGISGKVPEVDLTRENVMGWSGKQFIRIIEPSQLVPGKGYWLKK